MLGYIEPDKHELKLRDLETYNGYYCGLCKEVGETYGLISRLWLSNDMTFLAMFLGALTEGEDQIKYEHCIIHPIHKKPVEISEQSLKYAADMMIILRAEQFMDDLRDGDVNKIRGKLTGISRKYEKAANMHPNEAKIINESLQEMYSYEVEGKSNVRIMSGCFGKAMRAVFTGFVMPEEQERIVGSFAENLGCWLYLIDIIDDFETDRKENRFNPLLDLGITDRRRARDMIEPALNYYLDEICKAYDLINFRKNKDILDNVIFGGLRRRTERVLAGEEGKNDK